jgi:hypothetical protein
LRLLEKSSFPAPILTQSPAYASTSDTSEVHPWIAGPSKLLPIVVCPGCQKPMTPAEPKPLVNTPFVEITYVCGNCGTATERTIKQPD